VSDLAAGEGNRRWQPRTGWIPQRNL